MTDMSAHNENDVLVLGDELFPHRFAVVGHLSKVIVAHVKSGSVMIKVAVSGNDYIVVGMSLNNTVSPRKNLIIGALLELNKEIRYSAYLGCIITVSEVSFIISSNEIGIVKLCNSLVVPESIVMVAGNRDVKNNVVDYLVTFKCYSPLF